MEPKNVQEALKGECAEQWKEAMDEEMKQLRSKDFVDKPVGEKILSTKWVFKVKRDQSGQIERFKARLVARGFAQVQGVNFHKTFAPVIQKKTVRLLLALAAKTKCIVHHVDVLSAYLNSPFEEVIYVFQPEGIHYEQNKVWRLRKSLYGLKQSAREWHKKINKILTDMGLSRLHKDRCVYINKRKNLFIGLHVDEIGMWGKEEEVGWFKNMLKKVLEVRDLGEMKNFLSMNVKQDNYEISIDQAKSMRCELRERSVHVRSEESFK